MKPHKLWLLATVVAILPLGSSVAAQDSFPAKPINLIVGFPPGGGADILARTIAPRLEAELGTSVIIDNKPGASGIIATAHTARAPADGYTLYIATPGSLTILPHLQDVS